MIYDAFDVVVVPFPFTDRSATKRRPALVLSVSASFNRRTNHAVLAMITSPGDSSWPLDVPISDLDAAGLISPSVVRMKLFTLDDRFVLRKAGTLATNDRDAVCRTLARMFVIGEE